MRQLQAEGYRPLDKVGMCQALRWPNEKRGVLKDMLLEMERAGEIARIRDERYVLPKAADLLTGTLQVHAGGNAHLVSGVAGGKDLFIAANNLGTAMHGDKVVARILHEGRRQRPGVLEGQVAKILERANTTVVGTLQSS
ncbi:MAG: ribonuclease R, partial [Verrucomicrobia bacterium]|nr:ribonuclease R [Verrucomicrobiota bacterium]